MSRKRRLTVRQKRFAENYIELGNAEQAAIKAGYSKRYARGNAHKLVANSGIKEYIDKRIEELKNERVDDQQEILEFLSAVIRGDANGTELVGMGKGYQEVRQVPHNVDTLNDTYVRLGKRHAR